MRPPMAHRPEWVRFWREFFSGWGFVPGFRYDPSELKRVNAQATQAIPDVDSLVTPFGAIPLGFVDTSDIYIPYQKLLATYTPMCVCSSQNPREPSNRTTNGQKNPMSPK